MRPIDLGQPRTRESMYIARVKRKPGRPEYLRRGIGVLLACLLLWQQVAIAAYGCAWVVSVGPDTAQTSTRSHASGCEDDRAACLQHCGPDASWSHAGGLHLEPHFPVAIAAERGFLQLQFTRTGPTLPASHGSTPQRRIPARLLFCSLQI